MIVVSSSGNFLCDSLNELAVKLREFRRKVGAALYCDGRVKSSIVKGICRAFARTVALGIEDSIGCFQRFMLISLLP